MKRALITGITGQDGAYLAEFLLDKNYEVYGTYRRLSTPNFWRLQSLDIFEKIHLIPADLIDTHSVLEAIRISDPDEIYNLAAQSFVGASFEQPTATGSVTGIGVTGVLEAIRQLNPDIRFYQSSTSELYGNNCKGRQVNENVSFSPASPYAAAKLYGYWITKIYREAYGIFASNGILFNHESPLRGLEFVTRKISNIVAKIALGMKEKLVLGNVEAMRDWGYAPEYVESMWLMLQQKEAGDYVIATNEAHSVKEFYENAFNTLGLNWQEHTEVDKRFLRPLDVNYLKGDYSKAEEAFGWRPKTKFNDLVKIMVMEDFKRWEMVNNGESFPWDAPNYPSEASIVTRALKV